MGRFTLAVEDMPEDHWDLLLAFTDLIETALLEPSVNLEPAYAFLRRHFTRDTGMSDLVPDFVEDSADLPALTRYLARTGLSIDEQIAHVHEAFEPLGEYMELVFRPRSTNYARTFWPDKPKDTPFAPLPGSLPVAIEPTPSSSEDEPFDNFDMPLTARAQRVVRLAPIALEGLERLIRDRSIPGASNASQQLLWEEIDALHRLHRELGDLLRLARAGRPFETQWAAVSELFQGVFRLGKETGELFVNGLPPLAASALPALGTLKACEAMLHLDTTSSATIAAGVVAGTFALKPGTKKTST